MTWDDRRHAWLCSIGYDARFAVRSLSRRPRGFVAVVSMLGLAIGITTAMFTWERRQDGVTC